MLAGEFMRTAFESTDEEKIPTNFDVVSCPANIIDLQMVSARISVTARNNTNRTWETISSSANLQPWRWETLALTRGEVFNNRVNGNGRGSDKPSKLMTSLLCALPFNSCFFKSSSFQATLCASSLFCRSLCIPGWLEVL